MIFDKEGRDLICPACGCGAKLVKSEEIYGKPGYGLTWVCNNYPKCDYRVSCKKGTTTPTGELANEDLRGLRKTIYLKVDDLFRQKKASPANIYHELGIKLGIIPFKIGELNKEQCSKAMEFLDKNY